MSKVRPVSTPSSHVAVLAFLAVPLVTACGLLPWGRDAGPPPGAVATELRRLDATAAKAELALAEVRRRHADALRPDAAQAGASSEDIRRARRELAASQARRDQALDQLEELGWRRLAQPGRAHTAEDVLAGYVVAFRRAYAGWEPDVRFSAACPEVVRDQLVVDLATAVATGRRAGYVLAMQRVLQAIECAPARRALALNAALVRAFERVLGELPTAARPAGERILVSSLANLFVVLHDWTKFFGPGPAPTQGSSTPAAVDVVRFSAGAAHPAGEATYLRIHTEVTDVGDRRSTGARIGTFSLPAVRELDPGGEGGHDPALPDLRQPSLRQPDQGAAVAGAPWKSSFSETRSGSPINPRSRICVT